MKAEECVFHGGQVMKAEEMRLSWRTSNES